MKLSFAVLVHNEGSYIRDLMFRLSKYAIQHPADTEIVVVDDFSDDALTKKVLQDLQNLRSKEINVAVVQRHLDGDYASQKNALTDLCTGDWVLNLDADEWISEDVIEMIPYVIETNPDVEAYWLPRVNTVDGLTMKHVQQWNWVIEKFDAEKYGEKYIGYTNSITPEERTFFEIFNLIKEETSAGIIYYKPIVMWPDWQCRLYKKSPEIRWEGKVHELLKGYKKFSYFPKEPIYAIQHEKTIQRQEEQNLKYSGMTR